MNCISYLYFLANNSFLANIKLVEFIQYTKLHSFEHSWVQCNTRFEQYLGLEVIYIIFRCYRATFQSLESLEVLNLDRNRLGVIDGRAFTRNRQLKRVDLSHNVLTFASDDVISRNEFGSLSPLHLCEKLEMLNLANNTLGEIFADWLTKPHLSKLDLQYNKIKKLQVSYFLNISG